MARFKVQGDSNFPESLLRYFYDRGLFISSKAVETEHPLIIQVLHDAGHDLDETRPTVLDHKVPNAGKDLFTLKSAIGNHRLADSTRAAHNEIKGDLNTHLVDTRVLTLGAGKDRVEELHWVPQQWKTRDLSPELLRSLGTAWVLSGTHHGIRHRPDLFPLNGFGCFVEMLQGTLTVCLVPNTELLERGCTLHRGMRAMMGLTGPAFTEFMSTCAVTTLVEDRTLWIPYGYQPMLIPREEDMVYHVLFMPFINHKLMKGVEEPARLVEFANITATDNARKNPSPTYSELKGDVDSWTRSLNTVQALPATIPARDLALTNSAVGEDCTEEGHDVENEEGEK